MDSMVIWSSIGSLNPVRSFRLAACCSASLARRSRSWRPDRAARPLLLRRCWPGARRPTRLSAFFDASRRARRLGPAGLPVTPRRFLFSAGGRLSARSLVRGVGARRGATVAVAHRIKITNIRGHRSHRPLARACPRHRGPSLAGVARVSLTSPGAPVFPNQIRVIMAINAAHRR